MRRIGLMGGSFNPIHEGHLNLARLAIKSGQVDCVIFLPTGNPPHKNRELADKHIRLDMVRLAISGEAGMSVSREEIDRDGVIYTVDTLTHLKAQSPEDHFIYLIGADTLRTLCTWRRVDDVIRLCSFLVLMRPGEAEGETLALAARWRENGAQITLLEGELKDVSSSEIRRRCQAGENIDGLVPAAVAEYITRRQLYTAGDQP